VVILAEGSFENMLSSELDFSLGGFMVLVCFLRYLLKHKDP